MTESKSSENHENTELLAFDVGAFKENLIHQVRAAGGSKCLLNRQDFIKDLVKTAMEALLQVEMEEHLGYAIGREKDPPARPPIYGLTFKAAGRPIPHTSMKPGHSMSEGRIHQAMMDVQDLMRERVPARPLSGFECLPLNGHKDGPNNIRQQ